MRVKEVLIQPWEKPDATITLDIWVDTVTAAELVTIAGLCSHRPRCDAMSYDGLPSDSGLTLAERGPSG
jgi:hypothetical protein